MKRAQILKLSFAAILALAICMPGFSYNLGGKELVKNGEGPRNKWMMQVYWATLYVPAELKGGGDTQIIDADQPMIMDILVTSGMVSKDKFVGAIVEGFENSAKAGYGTTEKDNYVKLYEGIKFSKDDLISHRYEPGKGLSVVYNPKGGQAKVLGVLKGIQVKKAFWGIFLSSKPAQDNLKKKLLGK